MRQSREVGLIREPRWLYAGPAEASDASRCAGAVMEIGLLVARLVRREVRRSRPAGLSLQQFRALAAVAEGSATAPSALALHLGVAPATVSRLVDVLVEKRLLRRSAGVDRRGRVLTVTTAGRHRVDQAFAAFRAEIARRIEVVPAVQRKRITDATERLRPLLLGDFPAALPRGPSRSEAPRSDPPA